MSRLTQQRSSVAALSIQPYRSGDVQCVAELFTAAVHGLAAQHYNEQQRLAWAPVPPDLARWQTRLTGVTTFLAWREGVLAGFIAYADDGYIDLLFTHPDHARCGVASALYRKAEAVLRSRGCEEVHTEASLVARPGFERWGFRVSQQQQVQLDGQTFLRYEMRKRLVSAPRFRPVA